MSAIIMTAYHIAKLSEAHIPAISRLISVQVGRMECVALIFLLLSYQTVTYSYILYPKQRNVSQVALALSEIISGLHPKYLTIFAPNNSLNEDVDDFIYKIHELPIKTSIFFNLSNYFDFVANTIAGSVESWSLIFSEPFELSQEIHARSLAHRLSLFIFYWGAEYPPRISTVRFEEPIRAVVITRPRKSAFRVYYNQAIPNGNSNLRLVNWYDEDSLGLYRSPLLPQASTVYSNFHERLFYVPVIHSPPWHFVTYDNQSSNSTDCYYVRKFKVVGGRDHHLLHLIASKMNFKFTYLDPQERTQGSSVGSEQKSLFTGGLGMIQNRQAHFLFGDVGLSWERRKAAEFSFFTLLDSGAFATNAPRRLNEALAVVRPFQRNVWPFLIVTVLLSGPMFYFVIIAPYHWEMETSGDVESAERYHPEYVNEITLATRHRPRGYRMKKEVPKNLFQKCIWFTIQLFLKQSCSEPYNGIRARFLMIVYWIAATYVLADVYSAQLTSLFARPARESPIDTLFKLEYAMNNRGYQLYVEKDSSVLQMLENSTEIFRRLYKLMKSRGEPFLINSIEEGIQSIINGAEKVILGGRETLYFNIKRYGINNFQLSQQLYTRYSAIAVQIGCPYLESFNNVLMYLFESGIMDKITSSEYEKMLDVKDQNRETEEQLKKATNKHQMMYSDSNTQPINLRMLQGAFMILLFGNISAGVILAIELTLHRYQMNLWNCIYNGLVALVYEILAKQLVYYALSFKRVVLKFLFSIFKKNE